MSTDPPPDRVIASRYVELAADVVGRYARGNVITPDRLVMMLTQVSAALRSADGVPVPEPIPPEPDPITAPPVRLNGGDVRL